MLHHHPSLFFRLVNAVGHSRALCGLSLVLLCLSATTQAQLDNRHYLPPMPAYAASNLLVELSTPSDEPVSFVLRSSQPGEDFVEMGTVQRGSPFSLTIERLVNADNGPGLIGHALASAATPLDHYGLVLEADGAVNMNVSMITSNNRDIFSSKGGSGLGTSFHAWSHYNTTGNATSTTNNDSGHFVSVMAIDDDTVVTVEGPDQFFGFDLSSGSRSVTLDQYQSLVLLTDQNLSVSGTRITSTQPVSVISGDLHPAQAGSGAKDSALDHLVPTDLAGSEFVVGNLFDAASFGNVDSDGTLGVGNRYAQLIAVEDNSEVSQYDASGSLVRVITFEQAGDVKVYHLPGSAGTGYFFRATNVTPGYQANDFLMFLNSSADTGAEMAGTQLPALRSVQSEGSFCSGSRQVEYRVPSSPTSFFVYLPSAELSSLEVDDGGGDGFRPYDSAGFTPLVSTIGIPAGPFDQVSLVRYSGNFATAGSRVAFRAPGRIHVGIAAAPVATSSLGYFSDYDYAFAILDPQFELPSSSYSVAISSANDQPATVNHCLQVDGACSSSYRISALSALDATAVNLAPDLVGPESICFDFTPDRVVGAGSRSYAVPVTVTDNVGKSRSVEVRFDYSFTDQAQPLLLNHPDGREDVVVLLSADPQVAEWRIAGAADAALFTIDENGQLEFISPPDFNDPQDADGDNVYEVVVEVEAISGEVYQQAIFITVTGLFGDRFEQILETD